MRSSGEAAFNLLKTFADSKHTVVAEFEVGNELACRISGVFSLTNSSGFKVSGKGLLTFAPDDVDIDSCTFDSEIAFPNKTVLALSTALPLSFADVVLHQNRVKISFQFPIPAEEDLKESSMM
jgi:hypothetical protein